MEKERRNLRSKCDSHCLLMGLDGVTYQAQLGDFSLGGALIEIGDNVSHGLHVGEMCGLMFSDNFNMSSEKHTGKIVRLDSGSVGVSFNHQEHQHRKQKYSPN
jgi:c-di-GMP-binding flagellar brake protein YcgR